MPKSRPHIKMRVAGHGRANQVFVDGKEVPVTGFKIEGSAGSWTEITLSFYQPGQGEEDPITTISGYIVPDEADKESDATES